MKFKGPLTEAMLMKRNLRFLVEVVMKNKQKRTLYCPNLSPLTHCDILGSRIWYSTVSRSSQGYLDVWELVEVNKGALVSVNSEHAKVLVMEGVHQGIVAELAGYHFLQPPITPRFGNTVELLLNNDEEQCFIHIEQVIGGDELGVGFFPEIQGMGMRALQELIALKEAGHRVVLFYCVTHTGLNSIRPADDIDPLYGKTLREAAKKGIEILAYKAKITLREMVLESRIPIVLSEDILSR